MQTGKKTLIEIFADSDPFKYFTLHHKYYQKIERDYIQTEQINVYNTIYLCAYICETFIGRVFESKLFLRMYQNQYNSFGSCDANAFICNIK